MSRLETPGILKTKIFAQMLAHACQILFERSKCDILNVLFELSRQLGYISLFSPATKPLWAVSWTSYSRT